MNRDPKDIFGKALGALNAGDFEAAREALETLNAMAPGNADVLSYLGFAEANLGRPEGLAKTRKAAELSPNNPQILMNYAFALDRDGDQKKTIEALEAANKLAPGEITILNQLTRLLVEAGDFEKAKPLTEKLCSLSPKEPTFANRHLKVLVGLEEGKAALDFVNAIEGNFPDRRFITEMKARAARAAKDWQEAYRLYKALVERNPENLAFKRGLAQSLTGLEAFGKVIPILKEIRKKEPGNEQVIYSMAYALFNDNRHEECLPFVERILEKDPDHVDALIIKGRSMIYFGELDKAERIFNRVLELSPGHPMAVTQLTKVTQPKAGDKIFAKLEKMEKEAGERGDYKPLIGYTLGEMYERIGDYDTAFEWFKKANTLTRSTFEGRGNTFDKAKNRADFERLKDLYSKENLTALQGVGADTDLPIFIVGMPRSGTTLLEQVVSSHPDVFGAGELPLANAASDKLLEDLKNPTPGAVREKLSKEAKTYAGLYLDYLPERANREKRLSDKMPNNFRLLGFLQTILPNAGYILIRRNPLDICLSMYKGFFGKGFVYATDLEDLGAYYREFHELMDYWKGTLVKPVLEVNYEDFVADPDAGGKRVFDHLGLDWDPAFLDFYKRKTKVITMSTLQVREPVHGKAVDKWRRYEKHLDPLLRGLGPEIVKTLDI